VLSVMVSSDIFLVSEDLGCSDAIHPMP